MFNPTAGAVAPSRDVTAGIVPTEFNHTAGVTGGGRVVPSLPATYDGGALTFRPGQPITYDGFVILVA